MLANGNGIHSVTGAHCGSNLLISISGRYSVAACPGRILLAQPAAPGTVFPQN